MGKKYSLFVTTNCATQPFTLTTTSNAHTNLRAFMSHRCIQDCINCLGTHKYGEGHKHIDTHKHAPFSLYIHNECKDCTLAEEQLALTADSAMQHTAEVCTRVTWLGLESDSSHKDDDLQLDFDFNSNDSWLDLDLSLLTQPHLIPSLSPNIKNYAINKCAAHQLFF